MYKILIISLLFIIQNINASEIKVAVAANVSYAIKDLVKTFNQQYQNIKITTILGSSGKLTAQINHGAPFDVFMSANMKYPNNLYSKKSAITKPKIYAKGSLALISVKEHDFSKGLKLLTQKDIKKIAIANPKTAPYGKAAFEALKNAQLLKKTKAKFIYGESISQTVSYAIRACDIGIIATSSLYDKNMTKYRENKNWKKINSDLYTPIKQGIVLLKHAKNNKEAKLFYDFILSNDAKKIFKEYGYII